MGPGQFWIEHRKLEKKKKKIFDDYLFLGIKYCQNTVSKLHFTRLPPLHVLSFLSIPEIGFQNFRTLQGPLRIVLFSFVLYCILYVL